jgi:hypothetical protein
MDGAAPSIWRRNAQKRYTTRQIAGARGNHANFKQYRRGTFVNIPTEEKFLIIGAGPTGLAMARQLLLANRPYDHVEASTRIGGNWAHGVHDAVRLVSPRRTTGFPEFPMGRAYPRFPYGTDMFRYLNAYADHFSLRERIQISMKVLYVGPAEGERWNVHFANGHRAVYKGVLICNGHHWDRRWPEIPGTFTGELLHAKDYKAADQLAGKRVLVIGGGNSACDIASAAAECGTCAHMSLRRGYWFMPRTLWGIPSAAFVTPWLSIANQRKVLRLLLRLYWGRYENYGLPHPDHDVFDHHITVNSSVLPLMRQGNVQPKGAVARFEGNTVHFEDGSSLDYDLVVCATGYHVSVPFLQPGIFETRGPVAQLYGGAVPEGYRHLYIMATSQVRSGVGSVLAPYVEHVRMLIDVQDSIPLPLGTVLRALGERTPSTHILDPHLAIRKMRAARETLPGVVRKHAQKLAAEGVSGRHIAADPPTILDHEMVVN